MTGELLTYPNGTIRKSMEPLLFDSIQYYHHQIDGIRALAGRDSFILADQMGLGKSVEALTLFVTKVKMNKAERLLIVGPATLKENWRLEFEKFTRIPAVILSGTRAQRLELIESYSIMTGPRALVLNYEQVSRHLSELKALNFDIGIFDEAHYIATYNSGRTKACHALNLKSVFLLTGTPLRNNVNDLWSLFHMIDRKRWPRYWDFVNRYCVWGGWQGKQIIGVKNENELHKVLDEYMLRRLAKDVLSLSEPHIVTRTVTMLPEQEVLYEEVKSGIFENDMSGETEEIDNPLQRFTRLKQTTATTYTFTGEDNSCILDVAIPDLEEIVRNGNKAVVFTQFLDMLDTTRSRLEKVGIPTWEISGRIQMEKRIPISKEWGSASAPGVLVCMLQVAREGLNLVEGTYGLFLDELFVPSDNQQAIGRLNRIGQTKPVVIIKYKVKGPIWDRVEVILKTKINLNENIIEADPQFRANLRAAMKQALLEAKGVKV